MNGGRLNLLILNNQKGNQRGHRKKQNKEVLKLKLYATFYRRFLTCLMEEQDIHQNAKDRGPKISGKRKDNQ